MLARTDENIQAILGELRVHPQLSSFADISPAIHESSPRAMHFAARKAAIGRAATIKVGVTESELYWTTRLPPAAPEVLAVGHLAGQELEGRIGFLAQETLPYTLIGPLWEGQQVDLMLDAAALFHKIVCSTK